MKCSNGIRLSSSDPHIHAEGYGVLLDHRKLRTPRRELLVLPTEPLALAVAGEWASQASLLQPSIMYLVSLCTLTSPMWLPTLLTHIHIIPIF